MKSKLSYNQLNNTLGWVIFALSFVLYALTVERTISFWDVGEFIASASKLEVTHSPGAALFQLVGAVLSVFSFGKGSLYPLIINLSSGLYSAFTLLFMFWSITLLAKKLLTQKGVEPTSFQTLGIMLSGLLGALTFGVSDTFWFSAVEGEVYSMASLFTAILVWLILKWEQDESQEADRWIVLIGFVIGLSVGVHMMVLLAVPFVCYIYCFRKEEFSWKVFGKANLIALLALLLTFKLLFPTVMQFFGSTEIFFVNEIGLPFHYGSFIALILIGLLFYFLIGFTQKLQNPLYHTITMTVGFMLVGFSCWMMIPIRAAANPPMNLNDPDNAIGMKDYYNREQYGSWPVLWGENYTAYLEEDAISYEKSGEKFKMDPKTQKYIKVGDKSEMVVDPKHVGFFPSMYNSSPSIMEQYAQMTEYPAFTINQEDNGIPYEVKEKVYKQLLDKKEKNQITIDDYLQAKGILEVEKPSLGQNLKFFFKYQVGYMFARYFMWNFVGKQNDFEGHTEIYKGNWISGIDFIDESFIGNQDKLPSDYQNNKGHNRYFFIPLILGLIGMVFQARRRFGDFWALLSIFLLTSVGIVLYTSVKPFEPRERDYALVSSFYAFSIWIGLFVAAVFHAFKDKENIKILGFLTLGVPIWMGFQNYDDHDRSSRLAAHDFAHNYLKSLDKNAILVTYGDNDTYPLWGLQETSGFRDDVKVVNATLLSTDWNIGQNLRKIYNSDPLPSSLKPSDYIEGNNEFIYVLDQEYLTKIFSQLDEAYKGGMLEDPELYNQIAPFRKYLTQNSMSAQEAVDWIKNQKKANEAFAEIIGQPGTTVLPVSKITLSVDKQKVIKNKLVPLELQDKIVPEMVFTLGTSGISKFQFVLLDVLAQNKWDRPIYFSGGGMYDPGNFLFLGDYLEYQGFSYKLTPILTQNGENQDFGFVSPLQMYQRVKNYQWANYNNPKAYFDETCIRNILTYRNSVSRAADALIKAGEKAKALEILDLCMEKIPQNRYPDNHSLLNLSTSYLMAGDTKKSKKILDDYLQYSLSYLDYFASLSPKFRDNGVLFNEIEERNFKYINAVEGYSKACQDLKQDELAVKIHQEALGKIQEKFMFFAQENKKLSQSQKAELDDVKYMYVSLFSGLIERTKKLDNVLASELESEFMGLVETLERQ
ncbi:MAG: DUF2723 domain-containing protein [Flavobacteriaceae bacterium]|nr:MAG: DUF2723 domain-containing protein [Flavobacteriaceae bacterium]